MSRHVVFWGSAALTGILLAALRAPEWSLFVATAVMCFTLLPWYMLSGDMSRKPWTMKIGFDPYFLQLLGRIFGNDEEEYLVCKKCGKKEQFNQDHGNCTCGGEFYIHIPDSEGIVIRWRVWKSKQKWWPQRYWVWPSRDERKDQSPYHYWSFLGRKWFKRSDLKPDWWDKEE